MDSVIVIGGGAAGAMAAIEIRRRDPSRRVTLLEAGPKLLAKVAVTGGGRCNLTNTFEGVEDLRSVYPRGAQLMKRALRAFSQEDTMRWFEAEGVALTLRDAPCVFPTSQDAMQIVRTLERLLRRSGVEVLTGQRVTAVHTAEGGFVVRTEAGEYAAEKAVVTTGGAPKGLPFLAPLGLETVPPVPSLFTLRVDDAGLRALMGTLAEVELALPGTPFRSSGTLLLTDWGISGPATLRLSSYAARHLAEVQYRGPLQVNWLPEQRAEEAIRALVAANPRKALASVRPDGLTARLWEFLLGRAGLRADIRCAELGSKGMARLAELLRADRYELAGRVHFKEEFVTSGGVALSEISLSTLEARRYPGLFFAGEVLDVDAVTGGFNLQAAWSMAQVVASSV